MLHTSFIYAGDKQRLAKVPLPYVELCKFLPPGFKVQEDEAEKSEFEKQLAKALGLPSGQKKVNLTLPQWVVSYGRYGRTAQAAGQMTANACVKHQENVLKVAHMSDDKTAVLYDSLCRKKWARDASCGETNSDGTPVFNVDAATSKVDQDALETAKQAVKQAGGTGIVHVARAGCCASWGSGRAYAHVYVVRGFRPSVCTCCDQRVYVCIFVRPCVIRGGSIICGNCGKSGHKTEHCWSKKRKFASNDEADGEKNKKGKGKGKGRGKWRS